MHELLWPTKLLLSGGGAKYKMNDEDKGRCIEKKTGGIKKF